MSYAGGRIVLAAGSQTYFAGIRRLVAGNQTYFASIRRLVAGNQTYFAGKKTYFAGKKTGLCAALCFYIGAFAPLEENLEGHRPSKPPTNASCAAPLTLSKRGEAPLLGCD
jgi:hypothetical protein